MTKFQFASTAFTVIGNAVKTLWAVGVPILPLLLPGAAVSPGASNCNLRKAPAFTVIAGLVLGVRAPLLAVMVAVPTVFNVTPKTFVPDTSTALAGAAALVSLNVTPTRSAILLTTFQFPSTALTVMLKAAPAVSAVGVPDLPEPVPGTA